MTASAVDVGRGAVRRVKWEQRMYWRNPAAAGFTFALPLLFLVVFIAINGNDQVRFEGVPVRYAQYYVPTIIGFGLISACYTNLSLILSFRREQGILKRTRGTPISPVAYLMGLVGHVIIVSALICTLVLVLGLGAYGVHWTGRYLGLAVTIAGGAFAFSALGFAVSTFVPNEDAAPAMINFVLFPLLFISGTFEPVRAGTALARVASVFPVQHLNLLMVGMFDPFGHGTGVVGRHLVVVLVWGVAGIIVAARRFRWEPRTS